MRPFCHVIMIGDELILAGKLQLKKLQKKKPEKNSGFDGAWTRASQILVGRSTNWATKPHVGSEANFSGSFLPRKGVIICDYDYYFMYFFLHVVYWLYYFAANKDFCINDMNLARLDCIIPFHPLKSSYPAEDSRLAPLTTGE